ncbi:hexosaminidase [Salegentibacter sp. 24]|jgi:hexosaminidase|uniref:beta-N-acetylhexosaminidase n=1 Tax=Salegentibacter sp. 24 TaxID=2183986 RepID=UPI0010DD2CB5|nr:beta-N-acetylhexosaminidase [Salegentibacter sp. 24]TDN88168.1 hexosaminidase [Salegentibacter sp. 24]
MKNIQVKLSLVFLVLFQLGLSAQELEVAKPAIIPKPSEIEWKDDFFTLQKSTVVCFNPGAETSAAWLQELLENTYTQSYTMKGENCTGFNILLEPDLEQSLGKEGYKLNISSNIVSIKAATEAGLFYGIQTLRQVFPPEIENEKVLNEIKLPQLSVTDVPKFEWRGSMLDIARSFFGPDYIKKHLDRMAFYKLNRLHLHLTDDQGWRIEIKQKPKLTELGSKGAVKGGRSGYLTQEQYKEIQEYAAARNIIIIPEIDMPGHIYSALMAYPELNCEEFSNIEPRLATPPELFHEYQVGWSKLCLDKPEVYDFVATVLGEMAEITKGEYLHIGGDEIEDERYKEFVIKADSIVRGLGKTTIGWEEVTKAAVDSTFISQRWNNKTKSVVNTRVIQSLCSSFYFDHANIPGQEMTNNWCQERGVSLKDAYTFIAKNPNTIGVEAPLWTEMVLSNDAADNRFWPRTIALAEVGWSANENKDYQDFVNRLGRHGLRLDLMDVNYFRSPEVNWNSNRNKGVFSEFMPDSKWID